VAEASGLQLKTGTAASHPSRKQYQKHSPSLGKTWFRSQVKADRSRKQGQLWEFGAKIKLTVEKWVFPFLHASVGMAYNEGGDLILRQKIIKEDNGCYPEADLR